VVAASAAGGGTLYSCVPGPESEVVVRGLDYHVPRVRDVMPARWTALDVLRDSGHLKGYSVPPGSLAFTPDSGVVLLPMPPGADGPREVAVHHHGDRERRRAALTFDTSEVSEADEAKAIIDELTRLRAPATFFVCGAWCEKNPELLREAVRRGFEIANHSFSHPAFTGLTEEEMVSEIKRTEEAIRDIGGGRPAAYFRPPYGSIDARVRQVVASLGYSVVMWSTDTLDWHPSTTQQLIRDRVTVNTRNGDIVLMHTLGGFTRSALIEVVYNLRTMGFELTTVSGVLQQ
jgi:peptidoglycan/xylan/chitin deacetylase (PgdA/CDA1 family)